MNLRTIWRMLVARRFLLISLFLIGGISGLVISRLLPNLYEAQARLLVNTTRPDPVTNTALPPRGTDTFIKTQAELVRDYRVAGAVVDAFNWTRSPQLQAAYAKRRGDADLDMRQWLAKQVAQNTNAWMDGTQPILVISYTSTSAETSRRAVEALRQAMIEQTIAVRRQAAARDAQWYTAQADRLKERLAAAEARKSAFERKNGILLDDDNVDAETAKLRALAGAAAAPVIQAAPAAPVSAPSQAQLASVDAQIATARATLGPNHPELVALQQQRAALAASVSRELAAGRAALARPSGPSASSLYSQQVQKVLSQRGLIGEAQRLGGDVAVLKDQLNKTTQRATEFELESQTTESGFTPIGAIAAPATPLSPGIALFLLLGAVAGLGLGIVVALGLELLFRRVRGEEDLMLDDVPVIGSMVSTKPKQRPGLFGWLWPQPTVPM
jgi:uncharacterized protein involved in exopolysaccharide biosynthesis